MTNRELMQYNLNQLKLGLYNPDRFHILINELEQTMSLYPKRKIIAWLFAYNDRYEDLPVNLLCNENELLLVCADISLKKIDDEIKLLKVR